ncbi:FG-GAP-like repeat-containing protein [Spirosoma soli]|uniref:FG-GAP-like repeat-containing protein n=1 Tax=Spirosoma soli TaxID=1770529 RepID=A0ABW5LZ64_9BACT
MKKAFTLFGCLLAVAALAQSGRKISFQYDQRPTVSIDGRTLLNPWVGGLNATQYSTIRLNDDNRDDLVVFDRTTDKVSTFIAIDNPAGGGLAWQYAPEYETIFPFVYSWMLLVDYDGDGRKDIFTYGAGTVRVFRNELQNSKTTFRQITDRIITEGFNGQLPLYVALTDIPAIVDYDGDGDVDIITFDSSGNLVAYQQNMSVETTGKKDGLNYKRMGGTCWGHFSKEYCNDFMFGIQCDDGAGRIDPRPSGAKPQHTGNTLTVLDANGDGTNDLLFGFVSCENVAMLRNAGPNNDKANFTSYDSLYPGPTPIRFPAFPATFWEDVDGDGQKDLLASPNVETNENQAFDFQASGWYYKNAGTNEKPDFRLVQKDFLQNEMIDLGERAAPALADLDGDGDMDMLVGVGYTGPRYNSAYRAGIWQFENKGTTQNPAFVLVTTDYLGLKKSTNLNDVAPYFVDVDLNGSVDLVLFGTGVQSTEVRVLLNEAAQGAAAQYDLTKAVRWAVSSFMEVSDLPTLTDIDRDGKLDLLLGKSDGTIDYYRNAGTATNPVFQLQNQNFGGFTVDDSFYTGARSLVVADVNGDRKNELIAAALNGTVRIYNFPDRPDQPLTLLDSLPTIGLPGKALMAAVADLDGDQLPDLMLGSRGGGLRYLKNTSSKATGSPEDPTVPWAYPNPTDRYLTIRAPHDGQVELISLSGQIVIASQPVRADADTVLDVSGLPDATYLLRLTAPNQSAMVQKIVVWK